MLRAGITRSKNRYTFHTFLPSSLPIFTTSSTDFCSLTVFILPCPHSYPRPGCRAHLLSPDSLPSAPPSSPPPGPGWMCPCSLSSFAVAPSTQMWRLSASAAHGAEPATAPPVLPPAQRLTARFPQHPTVVNSCHVAARTQGSDLGVLDHTVLFAPRHSPVLLPCPDSSKLWRHDPRLPLHPAPLPCPQPPAAAADSVSAGGPGSKSESRHPRASCVALSPRAAAHRLRE